MDPVSNQRNEHVRFERVDINKERIDLNYIKLC